MSIKRRLAILGGVTVASAGLMVGPTALAAPPRDVGQVFEVTCLGMDPFDIVVPPGDAPFTPAFTLDGHQVFIPYRVTITISGQEPFTVEKNAPIPAGALTCPAVGTMDGQRVTVTVTAVQRGAP
jgi:hypothetical protein